MKHTLSIYLKLLFCLFILPVYSQNGKFFTTDRELCNSLINQVYQDRKGFIWIATENGLNRFDGSRFITYKHIEGDSTSISNNYVRTVFEDSHNRIWVGTMTGLMRYHRETDSFEPVRFSSYVSNPRYHITSIAETSNNQLWVSTTGQGIYYSDSDNIDFKRAFVEQGDNAVFVNGILYDSNHSLWFIVENYGLLCYNTGNNRMNYYTWEDCFRGEQVVAIKENKVGTIYAGTQNGSLYSLNAESGTFVNALSSKGESLTIKTLAVNNENKLFVGTDGQGLKCLNQEKAVLENYEVMTAPFDFSKGKVHSILEDKDNNLWLGIFQKGLLLIPGSTNRFDYIGYKSLKNNTIGSCCVLGIQEDQNGLLWIGTDNDGLYSINSRYEMVNHFRPTNDKNSVPNTVMSLCEDSEHNLWVGAYWKGLARVDKHSGKCFYVDSLENTKVYCMKEDRQKRLWIATNGSGLFCYDLRSHSVRHWQAPAEVPDLKDSLLRNNWINALLIDKNDRLWIGTYNGLCCMDLKTGNFIADKNFLSDLSTYVIYALSEDSSGRIWAGTSQGLALCDVNSGQMTLYTDKEGLPSNVVCGIVEDEYQNMWISTYMGVCCLNQEDMKFTNYFSSDGLQGNEFSRGAFCKDRKGKIYFGGNNGVTCFFSRNIIDRKKNLKVMISELSLGGKSVKKGDRSGAHQILDNSIYDASSIRLSYRDNTFSLEFSVLDFINPDRISYMYRLMGNGDEKWNVLAPGNNRVTFSELAPGDYTFQVRGSDHDSLSNIRTVHIRVMPHWTRTTLAYIIYMLFVLLCVYMAFCYVRMRYRSKREALEKYHAEQISEAKLQFFINISHEIRTPMTLIMSPLAKLLKDGNNAELQKTYSVMYRNAQRILNLINQLLDVRKIDKGQLKLSFSKTNLISFVSEIYQTFEYLAQRRNITLEFNHCDESLDVWIDRDNFDKVLMNLLSNAFKFTPDGGHIIINESTASDQKCEGALRNYFEIVVSDTGSGIDEALLDRIFERFFQVNSKPVNGNFGTGIGLHLSRSLVELQSGVIFARNRKEGAGSEFVVRMPLGKEHIKTEQISEAVSTEQISENTMIRTFLEEPVGEMKPKKVRAKSSQKVLVVEDEQDIREYIVQELEPYYHILTATNGKEALDILHSEEIDLVVSDVMMPEMDGYELCRKMKSNINIDHIPLILLTAKSKDEDKAEGLQLGADAYIIKPFNCEMLRIRISNLLENRKRLQPNFIDQQEKESKIKKVKLRSIDEVFIEKVMKVINDNIQDSSLSVETLASNVGMSRVHMHRRLKELTNMSARDLIRNIRLKQAAELLTQKKLSVSEVAYALGFSNLSHFSSTFRTFYGVSPKEYVLRHENHQELPELKTTASE